MNNTPDLSSKLIEARKRKGLSQADAADKLNVSRQAISRWETGTGSPGINSLPLISELYDISIDQLFGYEPAVSENEIPDIEEKMLESDETSSDIPLADDDAKAPDSTSSRIDSILNREHIFLISMLVISSFVSFIGLITSIYIFIWTWRNRRHYKLILILSVICFLIGLNNLYFFVITLFPTPNDFEGTIEKLS